MKVVAAVDDSDFSRHALAWVLDHLFPAAAADEKAEVETLRPALVLVHALEPLRHVMYPVGPGDQTHSLSFPLAQHKTRPRSHCTLLCCLGVERPGV